MCSVERKDGLWGSAQSASGVQRWRCDIWTCVSLGGAYCNMKRGHASGSDITHYFACIIEAVMTQEAHVAALYCLPLHNAVAIEITVCNVCLDCFLAA